MPSPTREERRLMRQRGAGARELKTASFGFTFGLAVASTPVLPHNSNPHSAWPGAAAPEKESAGLGHNVTALSLLKTGAEENTGRPASNTGVSQPDPHLVRSSQMPSQPAELRTKKPGKNIGGKKVVGGTSKRSKKPVTVHEDLAANAEPTERPAKRAKREAAQVPASSYVECESSEDETAPGKRKATKPREVNTLHSDNGESDVRRSRILQKSRSAHNVLIDVQERTVATTVEDYPELASRRRSKSPPEKLYESDAIATKPEPSQPIKGPRQKGQTANDTHVSNKAASASQVRQQREEPVWADRAKADLPPIKGSRGRPRKRPQTPDSLGLNGVDQRAARDSPTRESSSGKAEGTQSKVEKQKPMPRQRSAREHLANEDEGDIASSRGTTTKSLKATLTNTETVRHPERSVGRVSKVISVSDEELLASSDDEVEAPPIIMSSPVRAEDSSEDEMEDMPVIRHPTKGRIATSADAEPALHRPSKKPNKSNESGTEGKTRREASLRAQERPCKKHSTKPANTAIGSKQHRDLEADNPQASASGSDEDETDEHSTGRPKKSKVTSRTPEPAHRDPIKQRGAAPNQQITHTAKEIAPLKSAPKQQKGMAPSVLKKASVRKPLSSRSTNSVHFASPPKPQSKPKARGQPKRPLQALPSRLFDDENDTSELAENEYLNQFPEPVIPESLVAQGGKRLKFRL